MNEGNSEKGLPLTGGSRSERSELKKMVPNDRWEVEVNEVNEVNEYFFPEVRISFPLEGRCSRLRFVIT